MTESLIPQRFLFRFAVPCRYRKVLWDDAGLGLDESHQLLGLAELEDRRTSADVRAAWNEKGLAFSVHATGKSMKPRCQASRAEESDGLQLWIDTRDVHSVHRATRFCHWFVFQPTGGGGDGKQPSGQMLPIHRAKERQKIVDSAKLKVRSEMRDDGYLLEVFLPATALTGFDPSEYPRLGFTYAVIDRELGEQTFTVGNPMPYQEDPSLWATLELVR